MNFIREYKTLAEVVETTSSGAYQLPLNKPSLTVFLGNLIKPQGGFFIPQQPETDFWFYWISTRDYNQFVIYSDTGEFDYINWYTRFVNWFTITRDTFQEELIYWKNAKGKLMDKIENTNQLDYSDSPQSNDPEEDKYITTRTISKSKTDGDTMVKRLSEIDNNIKSIYEEWVKDFEKNFVIYS